MTEALLRLGRSYQSLNDYVNAIEAYEANLLEYPRTPPAIGSVVPLAQCYLARGEEYFEQAEQVLLSLVNQTGEEQAPITPAAHEYRQALFLLGEMYVGHDDYEKAIRVLEEAVARYPDDVGAGTAKFLLANSYRLSSLALRAEGDREEAAAFRQRLVSEVVRRLTRAHDLFSELAAELGRGGSDNAEGIRPEYVRLALFYQADCLFDLGRFGQALPLYEEAAWKYHDTPAALSASVQILNCYQRMGRTDEARTALQRARQLVGRIPQERFTLLDSGMSKKQWEDYLGRVGSSALFR